MASTAVVLHSYPTERVAEATVVQPEGDLTHAGRSVRATGPDGSGAATGAIDQSDLGNEGCRQTPQGESNGCQGDPIRDSPREQHHPGSHGPRVLFSPETIDALRGLAVRATPGPWVPSHSYGGVVNPLLETDCGCPPATDEMFGRTCTEAYGGRLVAESCGRADAAFIATVNPQLVLALLDELDRLRA
jgi:hypothetical protein